MSRASGFEDLVGIMHRLRKECPWDREQNLNSLKAYLLEEAYECIEAIEGAKVEEHIEELGDVLLQVLFQAEILSEKQNHAVIEDVLAALRDKLIRRHPHIFSDAKALTAERVHAQWNEIKQSEKPKKRKSLLDGISKSLPPLLLSRKLGERSKTVKFDWNSPEEVWKQFESEVDELKAAKTSEEKVHELGDILFCIVQWARHEKIDAEVALIEANKRFQSRFHKMEELADSRAQKFEDLSLEQKEKLWQEAKKLLKTHE